MLSVVTSDALDGTDIVRQYPAFYRQMLADPQLYAAFVDALSLLQESEQGRLPPLPGPANSDLSFMECMRLPVGEVVTQADGQCCVSWRRSQTALQQMLEKVVQPRSLSVYRSSSFFELRWLMLLQGQVKLKGQLLCMLLEAERPPADPNVLRPRLYVTCSHPGTSLQARLHWGKYEATLHVDPYAVNRFPDLPLEDALNQGGEHVADDLLLQLSGRKTDGTPILD